MENEFWQFSDQLRLETSASFANLSIGGNSIWTEPFLAKNRAEERRNLDSATTGIGSGQMLAKQKFQQLQQTEKAPIPGNKIAFGNNTSNFLINKEINKVGNGFGQNARRNNDNNDVGKGKGAAGGKKNGGKSSNVNDKNNNDKVAADKRFKTLPASEALPRSEAIGGYIFVCNNDTMEENLHRQLFGEISLSFSGKK